MGEKLTGKRAEPTPVVGITQKEGGRFVGKLLTTGREVKLKRGKKMVYEFAIEDGDMPIQIKNEAGSYVDADVTPGAKVAVFAPTVLNSALQQAKVGDLIQIIYLGEAVGKNATYHNFDVERL